MNDTTKNVAPVDEGEDKDTRELSSSVQSNSNLIPADRPFNDVSVPTMPKPESVGSDDSKAEKKRNPLTRVVVRIGQSIGYSIYDVALRPANPKAPANAVYIDHFLKSTFRDFKRLGEVPDVVLKHEWIDAERLPFLPIILELPDMNMEVIRSRCDILFSCLLISALVMLYALYNTFYSIGVVLFVDVFIPAQILTIVYWFVFFLFCGFGYFYYNYHVWVIAGDRFGLPRHFVAEWWEGERVALFPFYDYYLRYHKNHQ